MILPDLRPVVEGEGYKSRDAIGSIEEETTPELALTIEKIHVFHEFYLPPHRCSPSTSNPKNYVHLRQRTQVSISGMKISLQFCVLTPLPHRVPLGPRVRRYPGKHIWEHAEIVSEFVAKIYVDADVEPEKNSLVPEKGEEIEKEKGRRKGNRNGDKHDKKDTSGAHEDHLSVNLRKPLPNFQSSTSSRVSVSSSVSHTPSLPSLFSSVPLRRSDDSLTGHEFLTPNRRDRAEKQSREGEDKDDMKDFQDKQEAARSILALPIPVLLSQLFPHRKINVEIERMKADVTHATLNYVWWFFDDWNNEVVEPPLPLHSQSEYPMPQDTCNAVDSDGGEYESEEEVRKDHKGTKDNADGHITVVKEKGKSKSKGKAKEGKEKDKEKEKLKERSKGKEEKKIKHEKEREDDFGVEEPHDTLEVLICLNCLFRFLSVLFLKSSFNWKQEDIKAQGNTPLRIGTAAIRISFAFVFIRFCQSANNERISSYYLPFCSLLARRWSIMVVKVCICCYTYY